MTAQIIDGKRLAAELLDTLQQKIASCYAAGHRRSCLAVVLVGNNPASALYVHHKRRACEQIGIESLMYDLAPDSHESNLLDLIDQLNADDRVDGILIQLPLPQSFSVSRVVERIAPHKDVDGFHPCNVGRLALREPFLRPCTPYGVMSILHSTGEDLAGKHAVVVGVSNIVGRPMALELLLAACTVTSCHRMTQDLPGLIAQADIVVAAIGKKEFIKGAWIKPGAIVVDVGIVRGEDGKVYGDVEFQAAIERAAWITPVPGGVGPMTVAHLMSNTVMAYEHHLNLRG